MSEDLSDLGRRLDEWQRIALEPPGSNGHDPSGDDVPQRRLRVTRASSIEIRPVHWLWADKVPLGALTLLAGREGIGKSTVAYQLAADLTRGRLVGRYLGTPRAVAVVADEDSWACTVVPRLMAAGADLDLVLRVDVETAMGALTSMSLPRDNDALEELVVAYGVALILLDPLISQLSATLDTHKDAEVRQALTPLTKLAERTAVAMIGLIHLNKSGSSDPLSSIMGSRAFSAVARAVLYAVRDEDDDTGQTCVLGNPKNNLGRSNLPALAYRIVETVVAQTPEGPVTTGRVDWLGESDRDLRDVIASSVASVEARGATQEAGEWLVDYLTSVGGSAEAPKIMNAGKVAGHGVPAIKRAKQKHRIGHERRGFPATSVWFLPGAGTLSQNVTNKGDL